MSTQKLLVILALVAVCALAASPKWHQLSTAYTFETYTKDFRKVYGSSEEHEARRLIFEQNLDTILTHNAAGHSYKLGVNHLADRTQAELQALNGRVSDNEVKQPTPTAWYPAPSEQVMRSLPQEMDYRNTSVTFGVQTLTATKNQGHCGSCWAHAATEAVETHYALQTGELYVLSQQQVTSCANNSVLRCGGTGGCAGGTAQLAWDYLAEGQTQEWNYGYSSFFGSTGDCKMNTSTMPVVVKVAGYTQVERNSVDATLAALAQVGPLAVSVDATNWHLYETGVFSGCDYSLNISMNHAVQLIGYGHDEGLNQDYWLVRNSWSPKWGENGTIRLFRTNESQCGWNINWTTNGGGCAGENTTLWACGMCGILYDTAFPNIVVPTGSSGDSTVSKAWIAGVVVGVLVAVAIVALIIKKASAGTSKPEGDTLLDRQ